MMGAAPSRRLGVTSMRAFYVLLFGIAFAGCSQTGGTPLAPGGLQNGGASSLGAARGSAPSLAQPDASHGYKILYAFNGGTADGALPYGDLIAVNGTLYGT